MKNIIRNIGLVFCMVCLPLLGNEFSPIIKVFNNQEDSCQTCAQCLVDLIISRQSEEKPIVLGLATGSSPILFYKAFSELAKRKNLDLSNIITFNLDEYCGLQKSDPRSYHAYMFTHFFNDLLWSSENTKGFRLENIYIPDGYAKKEEDLSCEELKNLREKFHKKNVSEYLTEEEELWVLQERANAYEALIQKLGPINFQVLGIGVNGHIGFAEPYSDLNGRTMVVKLSENTRENNAEFFDHNIHDVPLNAITMGIGTILDADYIALLAFGEKKSKIVERSLNVPVNLGIPATSLQRHPNVTFYLDKLAASDLEKNSVIRYYNGRVLKNHNLLYEDFWVEGGKIVSPKERPNYEVDMQGFIIAPGYIDLQINGAFGIDFSVQADQVHRVAELLPQYGVTSFLPTLVSCEKQKYMELIPHLQPHPGGSHGSSILGIHLEGPYFASCKQGAHNQNFIMSHIDHFPEDFYGNLEGVKIVTLAPEIPGGLSTIKYLKSKNIVVSVGHTNATYEEAIAAINAGVTMATHLFNAMPSIHQRNPGIIGAILTNDSMFYSVIADNIHVNPSIIDLAWRSNPKGFCLITDAMQALGLPLGVYSLGTMTVDVGSGGAYVSGTQTIAGSVLSLDKAVRNFHKSTNCSLAASLEAASLKPSQVLGMDNIKGVLNSGADADFIVVDDDLNVHASYVAGQLAWHKSRLEIHGYKSKHLE